VASGLSPDEEAKRLDALVRELVRAFPQTPPDRVRRVVLDSWQEFLGASVRDFVPLLVRRRAASRLRIV
jgi:hypothetical protein